MGQAYWVGVDWGTSNVRAWLANSDGEALKVARSDQGMSRISSDAYPNILIGLLNELHANDQSIDHIVVCGMAGAKQGWLEAPYLEMPARLNRLGAGAVHPEFSHHSSTVSILSGICKRGRTEDVMRGEETQLLGLFALRPGFEGVVCMPGTHSKWVQIEGGEVVKFSTVMTGELFDILSHHSVLRHSLGGKGVGREFEDGRSAGLETGLAEPDKLTANLFRTRAASLLSDRDTDWCAGYLSGLLVGTEVGAHRDWFSKENVPLIGSDRLCRLYSAAIGMAGGSSAQIDATDATLAGLNAAREQLAHG